MKKNHVGFALLLASASAASANPFPTRDQNPLLGGLGLPGAMPADIAQQGDWSFATELNWASTALMQASGEESLIVDAETQEWRLSVQRVWGERLALRVQIPYRRISAGSLDGFIDDWHDWFGLPEGARPSLPEDDLRIAYTRDGNSVFELDGPASGLGDIAVDFGYSVHSSAASALSVWLSLELPTGEVAQFTSNDALDVSVVLSGNRSFKDRWSVYAQAGATSLANGYVLDAQQRDLVWSGLAGVSWRAFQPVEFRIQVDAHTAAFDSALDFLEEAVVLTVGGALHFRSGWRVDLGVSEDIAVESAPDVVFRLGVSREATSP